MDGFYYLYPNEAEARIESLAVIDIPDIGSMRWIRQFESIYKLSLQAVLCVRVKGTEYVKDYFASSGKIIVIIHELICMELWKEKIFAKIAASEFQASSNVLLYFVLYYETQLVSLLGAVLFHEDVIESANDALIDLVDYCQRRLTYLLERSSKAGDVQKDEVLTSINTLSDLLQKKESLDHFSSMEAITIISHIAINLKVVPLCVLHRLLNIHDLPMTLVSLILISPWKRKSGNKECEVYEDGKWNRVSDTRQVGKIEGQIWLSLFQFLFNENCLNKYDITDYRKNQLLKLRSRLSEPLMNQIPVLNDMLRFLENLSFFNPPASKPDVVIEQVPEIREGLLKKHKNMWSAIANKQMSEFFSPTKTQLDDITKRFSEIFTLESLESMLPDKLCGYCRKSGKQLCSRCRTEYYCGRQCQLRHWSKHKSVCSLLATDKDK